VLIPGATVETGGKWLMTLVHKLSNWNSILMLGGSDPSTEEVAETLGREPLTVIGYMLVCEGDAPCTPLSETIAEDGCVATVSRSGILETAGGVSKPGSDREGALDSSISRKLGAAGTCWT